MKARVIFFDQVFTLRVYKGERELQRKEKRFSVHDCCEKIIENKSNFLRSGFYTEGLQRRESYREGRKKGLVHITTARK